MSAYNCEIYCDDFLVMEIDHDFKNAPGTKGDEGLYFSSTNFNIKTSDTADTKIQKKKLRQALFRSFRNDEPSADLVSKEEFSTHIKELPTANEKTDKPEDDKGVAKNIKGITNVTKTEEDFGSFIIELLTDSPHVTSVEAEEKGVDKKQARTNSKLRNKPKKAHIYSKRAHDGTTFTGYFKATIWWIPNDEYEEFTTGWNPKTHNMRDFMVEPTLTNDCHDFYLICDGASPSVALELIGKLKRKSSTDFDRVHIMQNVMSLGDSCPSYGPTCDWYSNPKWGKGYGDGKSTSTASETKPSFKKGGFANKEIGGHCYSWVYDNALNFDNSNADPYNILLSNLTCTNNFVSSGGFEVEQIWKTEHGDELTPRVNDSEQENNRPSIVKTVQSHRKVSTAGSCACGKPKPSSGTKSCGDCNCIFIKCKTPGTTTHVDNYYFSWWFSRKRFGDYGQIHFAKMLPIWLAEDELHDSKMTTWGTSMWLSPTGYTSVDNYDFNDITTRKKPPPGSTKKDNIDWYRKRTWFFSGDWPAFYWSIYNKINTCMHVAGEGAFFCRFD